jgi:hypothetical protein
MQVPLAVVATLAGVVRWLRGGARWLIGAVLMVSVTPFTLLAIRPTNARLLEGGRDLGPDETRLLLERWGGLHAVRSVLSVVATIVYTYALEA